MMSVRGPLDAAAAPTGPAPTRESGGDGGFAALLSAQDTTSTRGQPEAAAPSASTPMVLEGPARFDAMSRSVGPDELSRDTTETVDDPAEERGPDAASEPASERDEARAADETSDEPALDDGAKVPADDAATNDPVVAAAEAEATGDEDVSAEDPAAEGDLEGVTAKTHEIDDADPGADVEAEAATEAAEAGAEEATAEVDAGLDVDVELPASMLDADAPALPAEALRQGTAYEAVSKAARLASAQATSGRWDTDMVNQLRSQQGLRRLADGRLRLEVNEAGERMTLTLKEQDGVLHVAAKTATRATAEAMAARVSELREALADLGLSLGDLSAQADARGDAEADVGSGFDEMEAGPATATASEAVVAVHRHRIIA